ncbi:MAG: alpha/beta hydrolase [Cyclobacteriaceae bacterium]|nr:alpha/beta hydrolase [Cyclobacteriaceae bacterium]
MHSKYIKPLFITLICFYPLLSLGQTVKTNLVYASINERELLLDLYMPANQINPYLVIWIHGGAWHSGSKKNPPMDLIDKGYAMASVDYRLSVEAPFPAMIHDIKAAIRYLRGNALKFGYRADQIIIWGSSAGGHLAALIGTTNGNEALEGTLGNYLTESSSVQVAIDFYGPTNFQTILQQSTPHGISVRAPALALLLGKPLNQAEGLANLASPFFQVDASDPPMFIAHGDQDNQVPVNQSLELKAAYDKNKLKVQLEIVSGAGHGSKDYYTNEFINKVDLFIKEVLKDK